MVRKVLVFGASGMLGSTLSHMIHMYPKYLFCTLSSLDCDITNANSVQKVIQQFQPDVIINMAAIANRRVCEDAPWLANAVHIHGVTNILRACSARTLFVQISTAAVFGCVQGLPAGYDEYSEADPTDVYANTKYVGDLLVSRTHEKHYIVRTSWLLGGPNDRQVFGQRLVPKLLSGGQIFAVDDVWGSPIRTEDLIKGLIALIESSAPYGVYNLSGIGAMSKFEMAKYVAKKFDIPLDLIQAVPASYFGGTRSNNIQQFLTLDCSRVQRLGLSLPTVEQTMERYVCREIVPAQDSADVLYVSVE